MRKTAAERKSDDDIVTKAKMCWRIGTAADDKQLKREKEDLGMYAGGEFQWPKAAWESRQGVPATSGAKGGTPAIAPQPSLSINKLRQPVRQLLNQERNSHLGIELVPEDDFAGLTAGLSPDTKKEVELREGLTRRIQRQSETRSAHSWAFDRAAQAGRGFWRVVIEYTSETSFDQDIFIKRIFNQSSVRLGPHQEPDGSDATWAIIADDYSQDRYEREFPDSDVADALSADDFRGLMSDSGDWFRDQSGERIIRVAEYFYTKNEPRTLCWYQNRPMWEDDLPDGVEAMGPVDAKTGQALPPRRVSVPTIHWAKVNGKEVLDKEVWAGRYIPIVKLVGEELQPFDDDQRFEGVIRQGISSQQGINYTASAMVQKMGQVSKAPYLTTPQQIEGYESMYQMAATYPMPYLLYNATSNMGNPVPPPQRSDQQAQIQSDIAALQLFSQWLQDTVGIHDVSLGAVDPTQKTARGIALLQQAAQRSTENYLDNLAHSIRHESRIINDLMPVVYNNRPNRVMEIIDSEGGSEKVTLAPNALTDRNFGTVVKIGKSWDTANEEGSTALGEVLQANPELMPAYMDLWFGMQTFPGAETAKKRAKMLLPPTVLQAEAADGQDPQQQLVQARAQMAQASQIMQSQQQKIQELAQDRQGDVVANQFRLEIAKLQDQTKREIAASDSATKLAVAGIDDRIARILKILEIQAEERRTQQEREHDRGMQRADQLHSHVSETAQREHERNQTIETGRQALDIASQKIDTSASDE